jgi:hypothetical protein
MKEDRISGGQARRTSSRWELLLGWAELDWMMGKWTGWEGGHRPVMNSKAEGNENYYYFGGEVKMRSTQFTYFEGNCAF